MNNLWSKNFILIFITNTLLAAAFTLINTIATLYFSHKGFEVSVIGTLAGVLAISAMIMRPFSGLAIDSVSNKLTLAIGLIIFGIMVLLHLHAESSAAMMTVRIINGLGWGLSSTATIAMAGKIIPEEKMAGGIGIFGLGQILSMAIGPAVALWLLGLAGFRPVFYLSVVLSAAAIIVSQFIDESLMHKPADNREKFTSVKKFLSSLAAKEALIPALFYFFTALVYSSLVGFLTLFARELEIVNIGIFFSIYACALFAVRLLAGKLANLISEKRVIMTGFTILILACIFISRISTIGLFIVAAVGFGFGIGLIQPLAQGLGMKNTPAAKRGAAGSTIMLGADTGIGLGSAIAGYIVAMSGFRFMFAFFAFFPLIGLIITLFYRFKSRTE